MWTLKDFPKSPPELSEDCFGVNEERLPDDCRIVTYALAGFQGAPDTLAEIRASLIAPLLTTEPTSVGRAFSYWMTFIEGEPDASAWMMCFYQRVIFITMILRDGAGR